MERNKLLMKKYLEKNPCCEDCGRFIGAEVHHKISFSHGGKDEFNNYKTLCSECHEKIHIKNRSELTKIGIQRARKQTCENLISLLDFYIELDNFFERWYCSISSRCV